MPQLSQWEEQDVEKDHGVWKPEEIVLGGIEMSELEGGNDMLFRSIPPSQRRQMLFEAQVNITTAEKKYTSISKGDGSKARRRHVMNYIIVPSSCVLPLVW